MLKRDITYENFDGEQVTETFYFNLSKPELVEMEVEYKDGFGAMLQRIVKAEDNKALVMEFKNIVLTAYGIKSDDGRRFIKSAQLREEFSQTAAYDALFMELAMNDQAAAVFVQGILPRDLSEDFAKAVTAPPPVPPTPPVPTPSV